MKWHRLFAVARKEAILIIRDQGSLFLTCITPIFMLLSFGYALSFDVKNIQLLIIDQSQSSESRELIRDFSGSSYFDVTVISDPSIDNLKRGKSLIQLYIPVDFAKRENERALQVLVDGTDPNTATIATDYVAMIIKNFQKIRAGPLDLRVRVAFNETLNSSYNIIPGLIPVIMMLIGHFLTALTVARQYEKGNMEQLAAIPLFPSEIIMGTLLPYFVVNLVNMGVVMVVAQYGFDLPMRGSWFPVIIAAMIFCCASLALGLFFSVIAKNQLLAYELVMIFTVLPSFVFSGFLTDLSIKDPVTRLISYFVPARYLINILKDIYLKGGGWSIINNDLLLLILFSLTPLILSIRFFKKTMD